MVSVCLSTYNGEKFIEKQIRSILRQLTESDELIVSDDGSTDGTIEIIKSIGDSRINILHHQHSKYYENKKNARNFYYVTENFENALMNAKGDYIFLSDQDDIWLPERVSIVLNKLQSYDCVMCNFATIDENDKVLKNPFYKDNPVVNSMMRNVIKSNFLGCCMAFNRGVLEYSLPFPKNLINHDGWIGCISIQKFQFGFVENVLHLYRRTDFNVSTMTAKSNNPLWFKIAYRIRFLLQLIVRFVRYK